jgi:hypothetical protein
MSEHDRTVFYRGMWDGKAEETNGPAPVGPNSR